MKKPNRANIMALFLMGVIFVGSFSVLAEPDLSSIPMPYIEDGRFNSNTAIVVADGAAASDTLGAVDIAQLIQFLAREQETVVSETIISGGESEDVTLGEPINIFIDDVLKHNDIDGLSEGEIKYDSESYDYHDELLIGDGLTLESSGTRLSNEDYGLKTFLEVKRNSITYRFVFDDNIDLSDASEEDPIEIPFLGRMLEIIDTDINELTVRLGNEFFMDVRDTVDVDGKSVRLLNVGLNGAVVVEVDGETKTVRKDQTKNINGIQVTILDTFYTDTIEERSATLLLGDDITQTYNEGDEYIGEDEDDPEWIWELSQVDDAKPVIAITNDFVRDDDKDNPVGTGDCYVLPNEFLKVCMNGMNLDETDYQYYSIELEDDVLSSDAILIKGIEDDAIDFTEGDSRKIYINNTGAYEKDGSNVNIVTDPRISFDDAIFNIDYDSVSGILTLDNGIDTFEFDTDLTEITDFRYNGDSLETYDNNILTQYGVKLFDPEDSLDEDEIKLDIPNEQIEVNIIVKGIRTSTKDETINLAPPKEIDIDTFLVSELDNPRSRNLILIGGSCAGGSNKLVEELFLTCDEARSEWSDGEGYIWITENNGKTALLVAGYNALDTRKAAKVVKNFEDYELTGDKCLVTGTLSNPQVDCST